MAGSSGSGSASGGKGEEDDRPRHQVINLFESSEELSKALVDYIVEISEVASRDRGFFALALSGSVDNLPNLLRPLTKRTPYMETVNWSKWYVFSAAENLLPKKHPDSFYNRIKQALFSEVPMPSWHVSYVTHDESAEAAAEQYQFQIRQRVKNRRIDACCSTDCPRFDLIVLMIGPDGSVASLLPDHPILTEKSLWVAPVVAAAGEESVTFTLPVINAAANVAIVAAGSSVAQAFAAAMGDPQLPPGSLPAQLVRPRDGKLVWFADWGAASLVRAEDRATWDK